MYVILSCSWHTSGPVFIGFDEVDITVIENISIVLVPVSLVQEIAVPVTVDYTVVDGTAIEGEGQCIYNIKT